MKNVTSIEDSESLIGIGEMLRIGRQIRRMTAVVCMSIMIFFAMTLVPPIVSADCPDATIYCYKDSYKDSKDYYIGKTTVGRCWRWNPMGCRPCDDSDEALNRKCNSTFSECNNSCTGTRWYVADYFPKFRTF